MKIRKKEETRPSNSDHGKYLSILEKKGNRQGKERKNLEQKNLQFSEEKNRKGKGAKYLEKENSW